eukprot:scpid61725/ scgid34838/ UDP-GlcNAc:betaGal beta-1,3-N-acetylglucosaminyltransferase 6; Core 3 synthase
MFAGLMGIELMSLWKGYFLAILCLPAVWFVIQLTLLVSQPIVLDGSGFLRLYVDDSTTTNGGESPTEGLMAMHSDENFTKSLSEEDLGQLLLNLAQDLSKDDIMDQLDANMSASGRVLHTVQAVNEVLCGPFCSSGSSVASAVGRSGQRSLRNSRVRSFKRTVERTDGSFRVLILSKSAPAYLTRRKQMRDTWLKHAKMHSSEISSTTRTVQSSCLKGGQCRYGNMLWYNRFLVGLTSQASAMEALSWEAKQYGDILLSPYTDRYDRITWKIMWALNWTAQFMDYSYLVFVDDDCFLQMSELYNFLSDAPRSKVYAGRVPYDYAIVNRNSSSKWFVDKRVFGGLFYPTYVWGACLIMTKDVSRLTASAARAWQPWFGIDDAYVGMLVRAVGVNVTNVGNIHADEFQYDGCNAEHGRQEPILVVATSAEHLLQMYHAAVQGRSLCPLVYSKKRKRCQICRLWVFLLVCPVVCCLILFRRYLLSQLYVCSEISHACLTL